MAKYDIEDLNRKLIQFVQKCPFPFPDILREQLQSARIENEIYQDCYKILFFPDPSSPPFPVKFPTLAQGCQILKDTGPFCCQLFVEDGYVVQFEVVDMGLTEIDWDYFWSNTPIWDIEYG